MALVSFFAKNFRVDGARGTTFKTFKTDPADITSKYDQNGCQWCGENEYGKSTEKIHDINIDWGWTRKGVILI